MKRLCSQTIEIALPADKVFAFVANLPQWPVWVSFIVCAQQHGEPQPRPLEPGQEIDVCLRRGSGRDCEQFEVVQFVSGAFVCLEGSLSAARRIEFRFEQRRSATRLNARIGYPVFGGALGALYDTLFVHSAVNGALRRSLAALKTTLEESELPKSRTSGQGGDGEEAPSGSAKHTAVA